MSREGQTRVEIRPGAFIWMNEEDRKRHEALKALQVVDIPHPEPDVVETASVAPAETATLPRPRARRR